jgi:SAM-dependent methyltransferase
MTATDPGWIRAHSDTEDDFRRWEESPIQAVDFAVHIHYLRQLIKKGDRVLEVGAGAGRFTKELADLTNRIVVADLSAAKLQRNQRNGAAMGYAQAVEQWCECDMCDLKPHFQDGEFDAVVCYGGPLSYAFDRRFKAIKELVRVTRTGGLILVSARSLWGAVHANLPSILQYDPRINREIIETGNMGPTQVASVSRFWHAYRADEFRAFVEEAGASVEQMSASDSLSATWRDMLSVWRQEPKTWQHLIEMEIQACREPGALDMGAHIIAIARKKG